MTAFTNQQIKKVFISFSDQTNGNLSEAVRILVRKKRGRKPLDSHKLEEANAEKAQKIEHNSNKIDGPPLKRVRKPRNSHKLKEANAEKVQTIENNSNKIDGPPLKRGRKPRDSHKLKEANAEKVQTHKIEETKAEKVQTIEHNSNKNDGPPLKRVRKPKSFQDFETPVFRKTNKVSEEKTNGKPSDGNVRLIFSDKLCPTRDVGVQANFSENSDFSLLQLELEEMKKKVNDLEQKLKKNK